MKDEDDIVPGIKTILVGESGTGKTSIIGALAGQEFESFTMTTSSATFIEKYITKNDTQYCLEIWDTAGQERLRSLTRIFTKDSNIVIFVYDITDKRSFDELSFWVNMIKESLGEKPILGVVGNKKDMFEQEKVNEEQARDFANKIGAKFSLTSAKDDVSGIEMFMGELLDDYIGKFEERKKSNDESDSVQYMKLRASKVKNSDKKNKGNKSKNKCEC